MEGVPCRAMPIPGRAMLVGQTVRCGPATSRKMRGEKTGVRMPRPATFSGRGGRQVGGLARPSRCPISVESGAVFAYGA